MNKKMKWVDRQLRLGWVILIGGLILGGLGIILERSLVNPPFNPRIITGVGILLLGIAISYLVRFASARRSAQAAARLVSEEQDERNQLLRARAGNRAFWTSAPLTYALLMWVSFAENGSLPPISGEIMWYILAGLVVLPLGMYVASLFYDEKRI